MSLDAAFPYADACPLEVWAVDCIGASGCVNVSLFADYSAAVDYGRGFGVTPRALLVKPTNGMGGIMIAVCQHCRKPYKNKFCLTEFSGHVTHGVCPACEAMR